MQIKYQNIILRDMRESDIDDEIRWYTTETDWALWDAPWETEEEVRSFDPEKHRQKELEWIGTRKHDHRLNLEIDTAGGVHIGAVSAYCIDENFEWRKLSAEEDRQKLNWALGIDICDGTYWSGGWGTQALTAFVKYHLEAGYANLYIQTWSGNARMVGLAKKLGFRECCRKKGIRQVRGGTYDGLTFRLDREAFEEHCRALEAPALELYIPKVEDMWFTKEMQADPETMAYNAGWDVCYPGYHPDTGCIDFPESEWAAKHARLVGHEPDQFYAFVRERKTGQFVGEVNYHYSPSENWYDMGIVLYAPCRGLGYGSLALDLLLHRAFVVNGIPKLHNSFEPTRGPGLAIHRKAGFRQVGTGSMGRFGRPVELLELELTREEYLAARAEFR